MLLLNFLHLIIDLVYCFLFSVFFVLFHFFDDILQGAGVLQHLPGRACCISCERILIGSNDLHRFWELSYVGHAVDMLKVRGSP